MPCRYEIHHDPVAHRFTTSVEGVEAEVNYHYDGDMLVIHHTGVPRPLEGRGIASELVRAVFEFREGRGQEGAARPVPTPRSGCRGTSSTATCWSEDPAMGSGE